MQVFLFADLILLPAADITPDPEVAKLQMELLKTLKSGFQASKVEYEAGRGTIEAMCKLAKPLLEVELAIATKPEQRIAAHLAYFKLMVKLDEQTVDSYEAGIRPLAQFIENRAERLQAEINLRKAGGKPPRGTKPAAKPKPPEKLDK
jgi:hypothetical protein